MPFRRIFAFFVLLATCACDREEKEAVAPPPPAPRLVSPCAGASPSPIAGLPGTAHGFCVDPRSDVRRYGVSEAEPLDAVCVQLFNGECELYKSHGLEGVKTLRYVAASGSSAQVSVVVSTFNRSTGAYGFFSHRILGDDLPSQVTVKPFEVSGRAVAGIGMAVVWRGKSVVELTYVSEDQTPDEIERDSPRVIEPLSQAISEMLVGPTEPDRAVLLLEQMGVDPLGILMFPDGVLDVGGTGPGVLGYFGGADPPHRIVIAERRDKDGSADLLRLLQRTSPHQKLKNRDIYRLRRTREGAPPETWFVVRSDDTVLGVGPLDRPGAPTQSTPEERKKEDDRWEAFAIRRLGEVRKQEAEFKEKDEQG